MGIGNPPGSHCTEMEEMDLDYRNFNDRSTTHRVQSFHDSADRRNLEYVSRYSSTQ